jgi:arginine repressor
MAKKTVTKADRIRDYVTSNPGARPKDVIAALAKKNIKVTSAQVSTLVRKMQTPKVSKAAKTTTNAYRAAATGEKLISSLDHRDLQRLRGGVWRQGSGRQSFRGSYTGGIDSLAPIWFNDVSPTLGT